MSIHDALQRLNDAYPQAKIRVSLTGSGAESLWLEKLQIPFIQEVVANSLGSP